MKKFYTTALFLAITSMNSWAMESSNKYGQGKKQSIHNNNRALDNSSESDDEIGQMARKMSKLSLSSKSKEIKKTRIEKVDKKCFLGERRPGESFAQYKTRTIKSVGSAVIGWEGIERGPGSGIINVGGKEKSIWQSRALMICGNLYFYSFENNSFFDPTELEKIKRGFFEITNGIDLKDEYLFFLRKQKEGKAEFIAELDLHLKYFMKKSAEYNHPILTYIKNLKQEEYEEIDTQILQPAILMALSELSPQEAEEYVKILPVPEDKLNNPAFSFILNDPSQPLPPHYIWINYILNCGDFSAMQQLLSILLENRK